MLHSAYAALVGGERNLYQEKNLLVRQIESPPFLWASQQHAILLFPN